MKKITVSIGLALALALPAGAIAKPHPDNADKRAAKTECKTLRGSTDATREAFRTQFRSFTACVRKTAIEEAQEEQTAHKNAAKECKDLRDNHSAEFVAQYGERKNAYGKCVSSRAKQKEAQADEQDQQDATEWKNAAKECDDLRDNHSAEFTATFGDRPNAFGKCVSSKASEDETETS